MDDVHTYVQLKTNTTLNCNSQDDSSKALSEVEIIFPVFGFSGFRTEEKDFSKW